MTVCGNNHHRTTDNPDNNEPPHPPPPGPSNTHEQLLSPHFGTGPPLPLSHEFDGSAEMLTYFNHVLLHLVRLNHQIGVNTTFTCFDEVLPQPPTPNPNRHNEQPLATSASFMAENHRMPPPQQPLCRICHESSHHNPLVAPIMHHQKDPEKYINNKPTFRVYTKAKTDFSLTIRDGKVILAPSNPSDPLQLPLHWIKEEKFGINMKDEEGFPSFALVNKATGEAMKYPIGVAYTVQLTIYNPDELDVTVLWSNGHSFGDGYKQVRPVDNMHLKLDAGRHIEKFGGVHDGAEIILWEWNNCDHQKWTIFPYCYSVVKI